MVAFGGCGCVSTPPATPAEVKLEPSGDVELDYLRRLAVQAPLDELFARAPLFLTLRIGPYSKDEFLWQGVDPHPAAQKMPTALQAAPIFRR